MTMKKTLDCSIDTIPIESLKKHYKPKEIRRHCKNCPRYDMNWSCPPHDFNITDYIERYRTAYVIGVKVSLTGFKQKSAAMDYYYDCRHLINQRLLGYEEEDSGSITLIGGHCDLCDNCTREVSLKCNYPDKKRHSLESLGFKVSEIIEDLFNDKLQWDKGQTPDSLYIVLGILSNAKIDVSELKKTITKG